jgi:integrase
MTRITTTALRARWRNSDRELTDGGARGLGRLTARIRRDGVLLYYQYFCEGKLKRVALGPYDETGTHGLSLVQARMKAAELGKLYRSGVSDLHGHIEHERAAHERRHRAEEEAFRRAEQEKRRGSLQQLLMAYIAQLEQAGKQSARDAKNVLQKNVIDAAPDLAATKATEVPLEEFVPLIARLVEAGKGRTAAKLRAYLRAAYQLAIRARTDPAASTLMRSFGITTNPIASIGALSKFNRVRDRVLSAPELGAFLRRIEALPRGTQKDALELCLLLGGQRPAQLLRARPEDVDLSAATVTLYDGKGARQQPRRHVVPLTEEAQAILERRLQQLAEGEPLFSTDGRSRMRIETVTMLVGEISDRMVKAKEAREAFQLRDLRRTVETTLARLGVSSDIRAHLQSHGLGGVQTRHYDRHDYAVEKQQALQRWTQHLDALKAGKTAEIIPLPARTGKDGSRS